MSRYLGDSQLSLLDRLLSKIIIDEITDCWEFQGGKNNIGYGMIRDQKKMRTVHRISYEEHKGKIPVGLLVLHTCHNRKCCNPDHLKLGTHKDNTNDMIASGRQKLWGGRLFHGMTGKKQPQTICPHCQYSCPNNLFSRHHGNNCKHKQVV
jgi:hypothetical protein